MGLIDDLEKIPQVKRGKAWCRTCGQTARISALNFNRGWPECCGETMSLDSPEEPALPTPSGRK